MTDKGFEVKVMAKSCVPALRQRCLPCMGLYRIFRMNIHRLRLYSLINLSIEMRVSSLVLTQILTQHCCMLELQPSPL